MQKSYFYFMRKMPLSCIFGKFVCLTQNLFLSQTDKFFKILPLLSQLKICSILLEGAIPHKKPCARRLCDK